MLQAGGFGAAFGAPAKPAGFGAVPAALGAVDDKAKLQEAYVVTLKVKGQGEAKNPLGFRRCWGELINSWLNAAALLAQETIGFERQKSARCEEAVRMSSIVLDAASMSTGNTSLHANLLTPRSHDLLPKLLGKENTSKVSQCVKRLKRRMTILVSPTKASLSVVVKYWRHTASRPGGIEVFAYEEEDACAVVPRSSTQ